MIYKYYAPNDNSFCALKEEYFWCSKRKYLNDPMDTYGEIIIKHPVLMQELEDRNVNIQEYSKLLDLFGICCFTKSGLSDYFWNNYADSYKGWALEFDETNLLNQLSDKTSGILFNDVVYFNSWPDLNNLDTHIPTENGITSPIRSLLRTEKLADKLFRHLILLKEKDRWGIEDEIRIVLGKNYPGYIDESQELDEAKKVKGYKLNWPSEIQKSIIVGHNIDAANLDMMKQIARCKNVALYMTQTISSGLDFELTTTNIDLN